VRLSHIVRHPVITDQAREEAHEIISAIRDSVVQGTSTIERMARRFSDDPGSAQRGGFYEDTRLSELVPEFAAVAARSPIGEISQIFESPFGLHFLRVNERRGDVISYNHVLIAFDRSKSDPTPAIEYLEMVRDSLLTTNVSFESMARRHSQEESSNTLGGSVIDPRTGERELFLEALGPSWRQTLDTLEVGEISQPARVQLLSGETSYHIVKLRSRVPSHRINLQTDYERIEQYALQEKQATEIEKWVRSLRERVHVEMRGKARDLIARN
ncbi:MAG: peptidylprolyl isomerase, partial [Bacteroidota bacterium]